MNKTLVVLTGPTGVGKTDVSIRLARICNAVIISSDSRQMFKEMKIGTAVPSEKQLQEVTHYFIGNHSVSDYYNVSRYEMDTLALLEQLFEKHNVVFLVGGSMLYIDAVCKGIDDMPDISQELHDSLVKKEEEEGLECLRVELSKLDTDYYKIVDLKNKSRILRALEVCITTGKPFSTFLKNQAKKRNFEIIKIALDRPKNELYERINARVDQMLEKGLLAEVESLLPFKNKTALKTVGYRELFNYLEGKTTLDKAVELIKRNSRHYAKRQLTWFKRDKDYVWFHPDNEMDIQSFLTCSIIPFAV